MKNTNLNEHETTHAAPSLHPPLPGLFLQLHIVLLLPVALLMPATQNIAEADDPVMLEAVDDQLTPIELGRSCPSPRLSPWMTSL